MSAVQKPSLNSILQPWVEKVEAEERRMQNLRCGAVALGAIALTAIRYALLSRISYGLAAILLTAVFKKRFESRYWSFRKPDDDTIEMHKRCVEYTKWVREDPKFYRELLNLNEADPITIPMKVALALYSDYIEKARHEKAIRPNLNTYPYSERNYILEIKLEAVHMLHLAHNPTSTDKPKITESDEDLWDKHPQEIYMLMIEQANDR